MTYGGKMTILILVVLGVATLAMLNKQSATASSTTPDDTAMKAKAEMLAQQLVIVDGHIDVPYRLKEHDEDISVRTAAGDFDYIRAKQGGLNVPFMSIYVPASYQKNGGAKQYAEELIDMVEGFAAKWPEKFAIANSVRDVREQFAAGKISLAMGMENGAPIEDDLENVAYFHRRGIRYITLTHSKWNQLCDSSYDPERKWNGLSEFGKKAIFAMNVAGIMVDISHVSDSTFYQVIALTKAPVIASHSSCRHFTPGWERNMNDDMIKALAGNGGVIMINFGSYFLQQEFQEQSDQLQSSIREYLEKENISRDSERGRTYSQQQRHAHPLGTIADVVAHIDHVVQLAGIDHVGLGSDFDGVFALPAGLQDVAGFPNLIQALLQKGYSEKDIAKICGENSLRVWSEVEAVATKLQQAID